MKRFLLLAALTLAWGSLWAQDVVRHVNQTTPDSIPATAIPADSIAIDDDDDGPNVIGAKSSPRHVKGEANILGAPIYYDADGNAIGTGEPATRSVLLPHGDAVLMPVTPPERNHFNHFFFEGEILSSHHNAAAGFNITYLPKRVGVYGSLLFSAPRRPYFSLGAALRLSGNTSPLDIHIYGGITWNRSLGAEAGLRFAEPARNNLFAWRSGSIGWANFNGYNYLTIGLSLELAALAGILFFWWW